MGKSCVVTVVQAEVAPDRGDGLARTAQFTHAAARSGAELIVFPDETAICHMDEQPRYRI